MSNVRSRGRGRGNPSVPGPAEPSGDQGHAQPPDGSHRGTRGSRSRGRQRAPGLILDGVQGHAGPSGVPHPAGPSGGQDHAGPSGGRGGEKRKRTERNLDNAEILQQVFTEDSDDEDIMSELNDNIEDFIMDEDEIDQT